ncbi:MAG: ferrochelatase [Campylobacterota bacterium]|nr:ferrochelatase [Campylobacterota bacterium]
MKQAVILLNMGGPNNLNEVEMFLTNMFDDPNILTMKSALLRKFVGSMITFSRTESAQEIYSQLGGKSPIVGHTKKLVSSLQQRFDENTYVDFVMRYTPPFASDVVEKLKALNVEKIFLLPLYPQYSTTTTKSSLEDFEEALQRSGLDAILVETKHYFENILLNKAIVNSIRETVSDDESDSFDLIFSAHGLPQKIVDAGDPYERHVRRHVALIQEELRTQGVKFNAVHLAYQSKIGPMKWLEPALDSTLKSMLNKKVVIYPIAFTVDNSETDFELGVEYEEVAQEQGFSEYRVCKCLNDDTLFVDALYDIYEKMDA